MQARSLQKNYKTNYQFHIAIMKVSHFVERKYYNVTTTHVSIKLPNEVITL